MAEEWPQVSLLLITYKRLELALRTLTGVRKNLEYPGSLHIHVADDGSGGRHIEQLVAEAWKDPRTSEVTWTDACRAGVGRSMNLGQRECWSRSDFVLWLEDDWELQQLFDFRPCVRLLEQHSNVGMVRFGNLPHKTVATLEAGAGRLWWLLDRSQGDGFTFTGHASLRHRRFYDAYGDYPEGLRPGETEIAYARIFRERSGPDIAFPGWVGHWGVFGHIGQVSLAGLEVGANWQGNDTRNGAWL